MMAVNNDHPLVAVDQELDQLLDDIEREERRATLLLLSRHRDCEPAQPDSTSDEVSVYCSLQQLPSSR